MEKGPKLKLELCIEPKKEMRDFSYSYSKALLEKLKELIAEKKVFATENEEKRFKENGGVGSPYGNNYEVKPIAVAVSRKLASQVFGSDNSFVNLTDEFKGDAKNIASIFKLVEITEEFLVIFEKKK